MHLHQRLQFDFPNGQVLDGPRRYVVLRVDVLMGLFDKLDSPTRTRALEAFQSSVTEFGANSVRAYAKEVGPDHLLKTMVDGSASLGWGRWRLDTEEDAIHLSVSNSPFAHGAAPLAGRSCHPIAGMLRAVAETIWNCPAEAHELNCAAEHPVGDQHECEFIAIRRFQDVKQQSQG